MKSYQFRLTLLLITGVFYFPPVLSACEIGGGSSTGPTKFQPGHYLRVIDDHTRGIDGIDGINKFIARTDTQYFKGVQLQINWATLEPTQGNFNWSKIDQALNLMAGKNWYLRVLVMDRTFHTDCSVIPSHVPNYPKKNGGCGARIWEQPAIDAYISLFNAMGARYNSNPRFVTVAPFGESALSLVKKDFPTYSDDIFMQKINLLYSGMKAAFPNTIVLIGFNFPQTDSFMVPIVTHIESVGGGGMIWPDTVPQHVNSWLHYQLGKQHKGEIAVMPMAQTPQVAFNETEAIFDALVNNIGVHAVVWNSTHPDGADYLGKQVIPTVTRHQGQINSVCPNRIAPCITE